MAIPTKLKLPDAFIGEMLHFQSLAQKYNRTTTGSATYTNPNTAANYSVSSGGEEALMDLMYNTNPILKNYNFDVDAYNAIKGDVELNTINIGNNEDNIQHTNKIYPAGGTATDLTITTDSGNFPYTQDRWVQFRATQAGIINTISIDGGSAISALNKEGNPLEVVVNDVVTAMYDATGTPFFLLAPKGGGAKFRLEPVLKKTSSTGSAIPKGNLVSKHYENTNSSTLSRTVRPYFISYIKQGFTSNVAPTANNFADLSSISFVIQGVDGESIEAMLCVSKNAGNNDTWVQSFSGTGLASSLNLFNNGSSYGPLIRKISSDKFAVIQFNGSAIRYQIISISTSLAISKIGSLQTLVTDGYSTANNQIICTEYDTNKLMFVYSPTPVNSFAKAFIATFDGATLNKSTISTLTIKLNQTTNFQSNIGTLKKVGEGKVCIAYIENADNFKPYISLLNVDGSELITVQNTHSPIASATASATVGIVSLDKGNKIMFCVTDSTTQRFILYTNTLSYLRMDAGQTSVHPGDIWAMGDNSFAVLTHDSNCNTRTYGYNLTFNSFAQQHATDGLSIVGWISGNRRTTSHYRVEDNLLIMHIVTANNSNAMYINSCSLSPPAGIAIDDITNTTLGRVQFY